MNRIREYREKSGYSQKYVALALGIKSSSVSLWESGDSYPAVENLLKLADLLHCTTDELLGRATEAQARAMEGLSLDERQIITLYRQLTDDGKLRLFQLAIEVQSTIKKSPEGEGSLLSASGD